MALLDILITGVGTSIARAIVKMWLKDEPLVAAAGESVVSILGKNIDDIRSRKAITRQLDEIGDCAAQSIFAMLSREDDVDTDRLAIVANAAAETIANVPIDSALLAEKNLEPQSLTEHFLSIPGGDGGSPGLADTGEGGSYFSEREKTVYRHILSHASELIVNIASQLPLYSERVLGEILKRETDLVQKSERIIDGLDRLFAAQPGRNPDRFEIAYRSACIRNLDQLELFGVDLQESNKRYKLSVAYVTLEIERRLAGERESMSVDRALASTKRLLVRGPAGSGKTTLLQWAAVFIASRELEGNLTPLNNFVPFLVRLRDYADKPLPNPEDFPLSISTALGGKPEDWVHLRLESGVGIIMIDGVDETAQDRREDVRKWLRDLTEQYPKARFLVTSRPHAAKDGWLEAEGFVDASLQQMSRKDIHHFIDHWHQAVRDGIVDPEEKAKLSPLSESLKERLRDDVSLFKLTGSPLLAAIICALHRDRNEDLPKDRSELYRACIEMFFRRDRERSVSMKGYLELADRQKYSLLQNFAWWMIKNGESSAPYEMADKRFESELSNLVECSEEPTGSKVRRLMVERVGILRQLSSERIDFPHRTFQEYLAAREAVFEDDIGLLVKNAHEAQWREVAILAAGLIENAERAESYISSLFKRGDKEPKNRATLYIVAATALELVVRISNRESLEEAISSRLKKILPPKKSSTAKELASCGDLVVRHLHYNRKWKGEVTAAAVLTLTLISSESACETLLDFIQDERAEVWRKLLTYLGNLPENLSKSFHSDLLSRHERSPIQDLKVTDTKVHDVHALEVCTSLQSLSLRETQVSDISALASCTSLDSLDLSGTKVTNIDPLTSCASLKSLDLSGTLVRDISALVSCTSLESLDLDKTQVIDISALVSCTSLQLLNLKETRVSNISALASCASLKSLDLSGTLVRDISALASCTSLESLDLGGSKVKSVSGLVHCASLQSLNLTFTYVTDVDVHALSSLKFLETLNLQRTAVSKDKIRWLKNELANTTIHSPLQHNLWNVDEGRVEN